MSTTRIARGALKIPRYIARGPTDVLKALSSTVKLLPDQPPYFLQDDPFLLPKRRTDLKNLTSSKLSGRKAAKFILNKYPELFFRDDAEPKIDQFCPSEQFDDGVEFGVDDIKWCIENSDPRNGVVAYQKLELNGVELEDETLMQFFELLCYTNEEYIMDSNEIELDRLLFKEVEKYTWKYDGVAEKIFEKFEDRLEPTRLYSALIAGLSKYNEHDKAKQRFEDFILKHPDRGLLREAYSGLIQSISKTSSSISAAEEGFDMVISHMANHNIEPDLIIMNTIMRRLARSYIDKKTSSKVFSLLNDMICLGIEPSLCTYESIIIAIMRSGFVKNKIKITNDILSYITTSEKAQEMRDLRDAHFFNNIMITIARNMHDFKLATRVFKIFMANPSLVAYSQQKSNIMDQYFKLMIATCPIEETMDFYKKFVGTQFIPSDQTYDSLIETLDLYRPDKEIMKRVWSDIINFDLHSRIKNDSLFRDDPEYKSALDQYLHEKSMRATRANRNTFKTSIPASN